jgi:hydroxyacylglutathione hydrolase
MLAIRHAVVGPFAENTWVAACARTREAVLVDPGGDLPRVLGLVEQGGFQVRRIFLTHAHVDHAAEREWLAQLPRQAEMFGFEGGSEAPEVDHWHVDGESFAVGDQTAQVLHTPGHTRGSCSLWFAGPGVVFTGDTLFSGSVGRTDLPGGDFGELQRSITTVLFPLGDAVQFHCGHGPSGTIGQERRGNPFVGEGARRGRFV